MVKREKWAAGREEKAALREVGWTPVAREVSFPEASVGSVLIGYLKVKSSLLQRMGMHLPVANNKTGLGKTIRAMKKGRATQGST